MTEGSFHKKKKKWKLLLVEANIMDVEIVNNPPFPPTRFHVEIILREKKTKKSNNAKYELTRIFNRALVKFRGC